jgi:ATP-dependent RNA helicase DHR2
MPERVTTVFDSEGNAVVKSQGVKRKREVPAPSPVQAKSQPRLDTNHKSGPPGKNKFPVNERSQQKQAHNPLRAKREALLPFRKKLPIWSYTSTIQDTLQKKDVLILVGETGSGKSTQVPQFLLDQAWLGKSSRIAITQPRRVAAISLARRVADEMGSPLGSASPASKVGYSVRFDNCTSPGTRIKFLTEGMLLQEMLRDSRLKEYGVVIVDEVHERSVNVDLILGYLRNLLTESESPRGKKKLRVVVMSATADVEALVKFFGAGYEAVGKNPDDFVATCNIPGRLFPVQLTYLPEPTYSFVDAALDTIFNIHYREPLPGDVLVFLPGQSEIEALQAMIDARAAEMEPNIPKIQTLPLFAALSQAAQQMVFERAPYRTRKVILSTNIAETSVTVPGVKYVVDSGKMKVKQYRPLLGLETLLEKPVSKSSAEQRKGRAGRERAGHCYRLYTKEGFESLEMLSVPEILRCDLSAALLGMMARGVENVRSFPFINPPPKSARDKAILLLLHVGAVDLSFNITGNGMQMAKLPLPPTMGRSLIEAARYGEACVLDLIDVIACLHGENVFLGLNTEEKKEEAEEARKELFRRDGDHRTLLTTVRHYAGEQSDRKAWCDKYFVSHRAMRNIMDVRKHLLQQCKQLDLLPENAALLNEDNYSETRNEQISKCLLAGFLMNTARITPDGSYKTVYGNHTVAIHPSSVIFGRKMEAIIFTEYVFTTKSYGRNVSAVRLKWIDEAVQALPKP